MDPDFQLDDSDRADLITLSVSAGFKVFQRICEAEIEKFKVALLNVTPGDVKELVARQATAQAAAQFYVGVIRRINEEKLAYESTPQPGEVLPDPTEALING